MESTLQWIDFAILRVITYYNRSRQEVSVRKIQDGVNGWLRRQHVPAGIAPALKHNSCHQHMLHLVELGLVTGLAWTPTARGEAIVDRLPSNWRKWPYYAKIVDGKIVETEPVP